MPAASPVPTLSHIYAWDTAPLTEAATYWSGTAELWDDTFARVAKQMAFPGSTPWEGRGADEAQLRANTDLTRVRSLADGLHTAAKVARNGEGQIAAAKRAVVSAVRAAHTAGFDVAEDLTVSNRISGGPPAFQAARRAQAQAIAGQIRTLAAALLAADQEVATGVTAASAGLSGATFPERPTIQATDFKTGPPQSPAPASEADRKLNQIDAFRKVFGRDPVSANDWETAAALDPHSYNPKNGGVDPNIVVGRIKPVPGQGVVRTNLFIPGESAWTPFGDNLGDNRGFSPTAGPEDSRVTIYTDYDNGIVVARQNPSVMVGDDGNQVAVGSPDVRVSQNPNGSVLIEYHAADPFSPGGEDLAKGTPWNVNGQLVIKPTPTGPVAGGLISDFPAAEIYNDNAGQTVEMAKIMPQNTGPYGPLVGLPFSQNIGQPGLMGGFPDDLIPPPAGVPASPPTLSVPSGPSHIPPVAQIPPAVVIPYPSVELGPVANPPHVPIGK